MLRAGNKRGALAVASYAPLAVIKCLGFIVFKIPRRRLEVSLLTNCTVICYLKTLWSRLNVSLLTECAEICYLKVLWWRLNVSLLTNCAEICHLKILWWWLNVPFLTNCAVICYSNILWRRLSNYTLLRLKFNIPEFLTLKSLILPHLYFYNHYLM